MEDTVVAELNQTEQPGLDIKYTGASIIDYVNHNGQLPTDISVTELQALNKQMTQDEILAYYKAVQGTDPQKRDKLIKEWIPKPHVVYHSSPDGSIKEFIPLPSHRSSAEPESIFAAPSKLVSAIFMGPNLKTTRSGTYDGGETYKVIVGDPEEFFANDRAGYMYTLPGETFSVDPNIGLGVAEWTSLTPVKPISVQYFSSAIQAMLDSGVQIIPASMDIIKKLDDPGSDKPAVIKGLKGIKSIDELK